MYESLEQFRNTAPVIDEWALANVVGRTRRSAVAAGVWQLPERRCAWSGLPLALTLRVELQSSHHSLSDELRFIGIRAGQQGPDSVNDMYLNWRIESHCVTRRSSRQDSLITHN